MSATPSNLAGDRERCTCRRARRRTNSTTRPCCRGFHGTHCCNAYAAAGLPRIRADSWKHRSSHRNSSLRQCTLLPLLELAILHFFNLSSKPLLLSSSVALLKHLLLFTLQALALHTFQLCCCLALDTLSSLALSLSPLTIRTLLQSVLYSLQLLFFAL